MKNIEFTDKEFLPPGSCEAGDAGCRCPVLDNEHGKGYLGDGDQFGFVINCDCPLHGKEDIRKWKELND